MIRFYPLNSAQKGIWNIEKVWPNTSINNVAATLRFSERIDFKLLEAAINILIKKTMHFKSGS